MIATFCKSYFGGLVFAGVIAAMAVIPARSHAQVGNTGTGSGSLDSDTTGVFNTANGYFSLNRNTTGSYQMAVGAYALFANTTGMYNSAFGYQALQNNTTAYANDAFGCQALFENSTGFMNSAFGDGALQENTTGAYNVAVGCGALYSNGDGYESVAIGYDALSRSKAGGNIAIGYLAGSAVVGGSGDIYIGNTGVATDNFTIRIGDPAVAEHTYIQGIYLQSMQDSLPVYINSKGLLGTVTSSARFKYDIHNMAEKSDKLMDLRPVVFRYKQAADNGTHPLRYGLIAEEVAKVYPDLVQYDKHGKPFTVHYELLTPMMLDQLQKAHHQLAAQQAEFASFKTAMLNTSASLQSRVTSVQHTNQMLLAGVGSLLVIVLAGAFVFAAGRARSFPALPSRQIESCA